MFSRLTMDEYEFLKGNVHYWTAFGAAYNQVFETCQENRLGTFGQPTELGKWYMDDYELANVR